jgi:SAM-dependent methyltransferase
MASDEPKTIVDSQWGYHRLDPVPTTDDLSEFYQSQYYDLMRQGGRAPDLRRHMAGGEAGAKQLEWLTHSLYSMVVDALGSAPGSNVLELGCGVGTLVKHLTSRGFLARGVEPSPVAVETALAIGADVVEGDFTAYRAAHPAPLDAVVMLNVLEHVPNPVSLIKDVRRSLAPGGLVIIRVPNDFSSIQRAAHAKIGGRRWWIAVPDHISYFNYDTLPPLLTRLGYEIVDTLGDFPMELFLLMGRDYANHPELGQACHQERVALEMSLPPDELRAMYRALATCGIGRNLFLVARRTDDSLSPRVAMGSLERVDGAYRFVGLRAEDIQHIRRWRNAQKDFLRQKKPLTESEQGRWYRDVVMPTHAKARPELLLVSILDAEGELVGYGGLTNIDWNHHRAEISFLVDPDRAQIPATYAADLLGFWRFVSRWAFDELGLRRLFTETYSFRRTHMALLERAGMRREGVLRDHIKTDEGYADSIMHGLCATDEGES